MANGRNRGMKGSKVDSGRDAGGFVAVPWTVLDCPAYSSLSSHARALLFEVARQFVKDNNGRLLLSGAYMATRGWKSNDMLTKCKVELLRAGFIFETFKGHRPNKASWYAVTWRALDKMPGYDAGSEQLFRRGAYQQFVPLKNASLTPPHGVGSTPIAPPHGVETWPTTPPHGAIRPVSTPLSTPPHGDHLDMPSVGVKGMHSIDDGDHGARQRLANVPAVELAGNRPIAANTGMGQILRRISHHRSPHHLAAVARLLASHP